MGRHTTLKDVAQAAGVTTATVSYVINNTPGQTISPKTRERVLEAVAELGYMPNAHARTLRSRRISCVGVVIHKNLAVPRYSQMVYGIQERLEQRGYSVLLLGNTVGLQGYTDYVSAYLEGQIGGIIFIGTEDQTPDPDSIRILQNEHAPLVVFNCKQDADTYSTVDYDYAGGARLIAERVMPTGPKRLLYFEPQIDTEQERQREQGIREVVSAHPDVELKIRQAPITKDRIEIWDAHHFVGDTEEGIRLTERFIEACRQALDELEDGDAVIASWATWTHYFRKADPDKKIVYAELANNGESWMAANFYTRMPNYGAGITCADEVLSLIGGSTPQSRLIKLTNIVTVTSLDL